MTPLKTKTITVTPQMAQKFLELNEGNRTLSQNRIDSYAYEMKRSNWRLTGESIIFDKSGKLRNGQHRLHACIQSGTPFVTQITEGVESDTFKYMDIGKTRTHADVLSIEGITNPTAMSTMTRAIINYKNGTHHQMANGYSRGNKFIAPSDTSDFVKKNLRSLEASYTIAFKGKPLVSSATLGALHFLFKAKYPAQADEFCSRFIDGVNLTKTSAITILRDKLIDDMKRSRRMDQTERIALMIKAFNFFREGKQIKLLKWNRITETFPQIE